MRRVAAAIAASVAVLLLGVLVVTRGAPGVAAPGSNPSGDLVPGANPSGDLVPAAVPVPDTRVATILQSVAFHSAPGGPVVRDDTGENDEIARVGGRVEVLERRAVPGDSGDWLRVYVDVDPSAWPGDFFAWLPETFGGDPVLRVEPAATPCPGAPTLAALAGLAPFDRLRCAGGAPITLDARTVFATGYADYLVDPAFFGSQDDDTAVVGLTGAGGEKGLSVDWARDPWLDAVLAPGVGRPPVDVDVRLVGRFDDPGAGACRRTVNRARLGAVPGQAGPPVEDAADSVAWCRTRFVITRWTIVAGPERRPPAVGVVQLHRDRWLGNICAGVGMEGDLTFHIDLTQADPVWLTTPGSDTRIVPLFGAAFRFVADPLPGISDGAGLTIRDGTRMDPDAGFPGHAACPMGRTVLVS
jgi:hypothetical protein